MGSAWITPEKLAESVYQSLSEIEKVKVKDNINSYGYSIFKNFNYSSSESKTFIDKLKSLLGDKHE